MRVKGDTPGKGMKTSTRGFSPPRTQTKGKGTLQSEKDIGTIDLDKWERFLQWEKEMATAKPPETTVAPTPITEITNPIPKDKGEAGPSNTPRDPMK